MAVKITLQFDDYQTSVVVPGTLTEVQRASQEQLLEWLATFSEEVTRLDDGRRFEAVLKEDRRGKHLVYLGLTSFLGQGLVTKMMVVNQEPKPCQAEPGAEKLRERKAKLKTHHGHGTEQLDLLSIAGD